MQHIYSKIVYFKLNSMLITGREKMQYLEEISIDNFLRGYKYLMPNYT